MKLQQLLEKACLPEEYTPIHRWIEVDDVEVLLAAITTYRGESTLWCMHRSSTANRTPDDDSAVNEACNDCDGFDDSITRRDMHLTQILDDSHAININIKAITHDGNSYKITRGQGQPIRTESPESIMTLQYFMEKGLDLTLWNDLDIEQITIHNVTLESVDDATDTAESFSKNAESRSTDCVTVDMRFNRLLLDEPLRFDLRPDEPFEFKYIHPITQKEKTVHCIGLSWYDLWATWKAPFETEWAKALPKDELARMMSEHEKHLEAICPKGQQLPLFAYESEDGIQLDAYPVDYLDGLFFDRANSNPHEASSMAIMMRPDEAVGPHGHRNFVTALLQAKAPYAVEILAIYDKKDEQVIPF